MRQEKKQFKKALNAVIEFKEGKYEETLKKYNKAIGEKNYTVANRMWDLKNYLGREILKDLRLLSKLN
jgi:hypothetical protein